MIRWVRAFLPLLNLPCLWLAIAPHCAAREFTQTETSFESHGKTILVDVFAPENRQSVANVLVFHGAGGVIFDGPEMKRMARELTTKSMCVFVVHYFDGSGVPFTTHDDTLRRHHDEWLAVLRDAVGWVRHPPGVLIWPPSRPVGIYGYSMGAFLGLEVSSGNPAVGALVEQAGGVWDNETARIGEMPPVLMIHGRADRRVPFAKYAVTLEAALRKKSHPLQTLFFDDEGHVLHAAAQARARAAAAEFFVRHLTGEKSVAEVGKPVREARRSTIPRKR